MRFIGDYGAKTDAKGRVFLPAAYRKILEAEGVKELILKQDVFQKCLVLYPESVWNATMDGLRAKINPWNKQQVNMVRMYGAGVEPVELDSNGRILISKGKLQFANIASEVKFVAMVDYIEIWDKKSFEELVMNTGDIGEQIEAAFGQPLLAE